MADPERRIRRSNDVRGSAPREEKAGRVLSIFRESADEPTKSKLRLNESTTAILEGPARQLGLELVDDQVADSGESCEVTFANNATGETLVYLLYIHPDLVAPPDADLEGERNEAKGEDFTFLGFMFPEGSKVRIFSEYSSTPRSFPRIRRRMKQRLDIDFRWIPWNLVEAIANSRDKAGELETNLELFDLNLRRVEIGGNDELGRTDLEPESAGGAAPAADSEESELDDIGPKEAEAAAEPRSQARAGVFVSYSHADATWMREVVDVFQSLEDAEGFGIFTDTEITAGERWRARLDAELAKARVMVLLVTPSFLASDFIQHEELPAALTAAQDGGTTIFSILVSSTPDWQDSPIAPYQFAYGPPDEALDRLKKDERRRVLAIARDQLRVILRGD